MRLYLEVFFSNVKLHISSIMKILAAAIFFMITLWFCISSVLPANIRTNNGPSFLPNVSYAEELFNKTYMKVKCIKIDQETLVEALDLAYQPRYMQIHKPREVRAYEQMIEDGLIPVNHGFINDEPEDENSTDAIPSFYVPSNYHQLLPGSAVRASDILNKESARRVKRTVGVHPFRCEEQIGWRDMGENYFPRYIRSKECMSKKCAFGNYRCETVGFVTKILVRRQEPCYYIRDNINETEEDVQKRIDDLHEKISREGFDPVSSDWVQESMFEEWEWGDIGIGFCCQCTPHKLGKFQNCMTIDVGSR